MSETILAIPSQSPGGLAAELGMHFGKASCFTLVRLVDEAVVEVDVLPGVAHGSGGCMAPVRYLADHGVGILVAGGMGARPLRGLQAVGIEVLAGAPGSTVGASVRAAVLGELRPFGTEAACGGH